MSIANPNIPQSARDDYDERTPSERGYDDAWDARGYGASAGEYWSARQYHEYSEAFERGLEAHADSVAFGDWGDDAY